MLTSTAEPPRLTLTVRGDPVGQGQISYGKHGHGYHSNGRRLKPWRALITATAAAATGRHPYTAPMAVRGQKRPPAICVVCRTPKAEHGLLLGPVRLDIVVTFARPKTAPTRAHPTSSRIGDWDHHARSISDALTGVVFADDAQVIDGRTAKCFPGGHPDSLPAPGAVIRVWDLTTNGTP